MRRECPVSGETRIRFPPEEQKRQICNWQTPSAYGDAVSLPIDIGAACT
jgi:hypothetical protein